MLFLAEFFLKRAGLSLNEMKVSDFFLRICKKDASIVNLRVLELCV